MPRPIALLVVGQLSWRAAFLADLIRDDFECAPRGVIIVKGKGEMKVWQVLRAVPAATA